MGLARSVRFSGGAFRADGRVWPPSESRRRPAGGGIADENAAAAGLAGRNPRAIELDDAARRSAHYGRSSTLDLQEASEEASFKGTMTLVGCSLIWAAVIVLILAVWIPWLAWLILPVLAIFLGLQALRLDHPGQNLIAAPRFSARPDAPVSGASARARSRKRRKIRFPLFPLGFLPGVAVIIGWVRSIRISQRIPSWSIKPVLLVEKQIARVRRRLLMQVALQSVIFAIALGLAALGRWFLLGRSPSRSGRSGALGRAGRPRRAQHSRRPDARLAAAAQSRRLLLALDEKFDLKERVTTFLTLPADQIDSPVGQALLRDVNEQLAICKSPANFRSASMEEAARPRRRFRPGPAGLRLRSDVGRSEVRSIAPMRAP